MSKKSILIIVALISILIGGGLFVIGMSLNNWNFANLDNSKYVTNTYELEEDFINFDIDTDTAEIELIESTENKIEIFDKEEALYTVKVEESTLKVTLNNTVNHINFFNFKTPKISIYLSNVNYELLDIKEDTGDIRIPTDFSFKNVNIDLNTGDTYLSCNVSNSINVKTDTGHINLKEMELNSIAISGDTGDVSLEKVAAKNINIIVDTGRVKLTTILCENLDVKLTTGDFILEDVSCLTSLLSKASTGDMKANKLVVGGKLHIERNTGDVNLKEVLAGEIYIKTSTGKVTLSVLESMVFYTKTNTGDVDVPKSTTGNLCEIYTDTGDIKVTILSK